MIAESDNNGGWFIQGVDHLNAAIHLTEEWLDDYEEHQGPQHQLRWLLRNSNNPDDIKQGLRRALDNRRPAVVRRQQSPEFTEWLKEKRANSRNPDR